MIDLPTTVSDPADETEKCQESRKVPKYWRYTDKTEDTEDYDPKRMGTEISASGCKCPKHPTNRICRLEEGNIPNPGWGCACNVYYKMEKGYLESNPNLVGPVLYCKEATPIFNYCSNASYYEEAKPLFPNGR